MLTLLTTPRRLASRIQIVMKMDSDYFLAAEVVLGTGYYETVTVFDLGPWCERISGSPGALFCRENPCG